MFIKTKTEVTMTIKTLEECIELRKKYIYAIKHNVDGCDELWHKYYNLIVNEVGVYHFSLIEGIIMWSIDKNLPISRVISSLGALEVNVEYDCNIK